MKKCREKKRHFHTSRAAFQRLDEIVAAPLAPGRMYSPNGVIRCHCGGFVLTSRSAKQNARGKQSRNLRIRRKA